MPADPRGNRSSRPAAPRSGRLIPAAVLALAPAAVEAQQQGFTFSPLRFPVSENAGTGTYTVKLNAAPASGQTVTVHVFLAVSVRSLIRVAPESVTFDTSNRDNAQPFTVTAIANSVQQDEAAIIRHDKEVSSGEYAGDPGRVVVDVKNNQDPPAQVTGVTVTPESLRLAVSWSQASGAGGYRMQWKSGSEDYDPLTREQTIRSGSTTTTTITGLREGIAYTVRVIATRTNAADGAPSTEVTGTPLAGPPAKVTGLMLTAGVRKITATWSQAANAGGGEYGAIRTARRLAAHPAPAAATAP